ncbi:MAG: bifunctional transaldolase/phosoglucose isomerase [Deltaproteobacteria bacterium]|nr:bifunctional transaldolase/phosoglucose isomerase [Deltaproteobacteria bacterium]
MNNGNPLKKVLALGQSLWLDYLHREMLRSGELERLIERDGIRGITSNPAIFKEAIAGSKAYDAAITDLVREGKTVEEIYQTLVLEDVRAAADQFRPLFEESRGLDGYVSLEVSPYLARDLDRTLEEGRLLWRLLDRPNVMIKVPATLEGCQAIRELTAEGINVNATLLFSLERYRMVAEAYLAGLEDRAAQGRPVAGIASVASFFLSRIDTLLDPRLEELSRSADQSVATARSLIGAIAVASAKLSYRIFRELFGGARFERLAQLGAAPQRLLWASTGTKNPAYSDVKYVEELIGPQTVNTIPVKTLNAFRDHGRAEATLVQGLAEAEGALRGLAELGIDLEQGMRHLEEDGIQKFIQPFDSLFKKLDEERIAILEQTCERQHLDLGLYAHFVQKRLNHMEEEGFSRRFWAKDPCLWKRHPQYHREIRGFMGWMEIVEAMRNRLEEVETFVSEIREAGFSRVVIMGMGGSSMTPLVFQRSFPLGRGGIPLTVLDSTDPDTVLDLEKKLPLAQTLFIEASKSGTTAEPSAFSDYFFDRLSQIKGSRAGEHFAAITDPETPLVARANKLGFRKTFLNDPEIGGRYSALSCFGLVPAALMGLDPRQILASAHLMKQSCGPDIPERKNPALVLGAALGELALGGRDKVTFFLPEPIRTFGLWIDQLIAESTGKEQRGILPVTGEPPGAASAYDDDRVFLFYRLGGSGDERLTALVEDLKKLNHPVIAIDIEGPADLAGEFLRWECATAVAASVLGINPFDQPNVQESKANTHRILAAPMAPSAAGGHALHEGGPLLYGEPAAKDFQEALKYFLSRRRTRDYVALMAYLPETEASSAGLRELQALLRDRTRLAVTLGFGPRFLHSTGQWHKGGPNTGLFIQLTGRPHRDAPIPDLPYSFGTLIRAQAQGDLEALAKYGRRVIRIELGDDPLAALTKLTALVRDTPEL